MYGDDPLKEFLDKLSAGSATPGGGSASALAGALAASLASMVAGLTMNKKGYESVRDEMTRIQQGAQTLMHEMAGLIDRDADAYRQVMAALRLPKSDDSEKAIRAQAIEEATLLAAIVPLETMRASRKVADLLSFAASHGNPNASTDAAVGALLMSACTEGAYRNVAVNLGGMSDQIQAQRLEREAQAILDECREIANTIRRTLFDH
jgi:formiminotetrahydrofolate cyclodeaminase